MAFAPCSHNNAAPRTNAILIRWIKYSCVQCLSLLLTWGHWVSITRTPACLVLISWLLPQARGAAAAYYSFAWRPAMFLNEQQSRCVFFHPVCRRVKSSLGVSGYRLAILSELSSPLRSPSDDDATWQAQSGPFSPSASEIRERGTCLKA